MVLKIGILRRRYEKASYSGFDRLGVVFHCFGQVLWDLPSSKSHFEDGRCFGSLVFLDSGKLESFFLQIDNK